MNELLGIRSLIKFNTMHTLQLQVVETGQCPRCHTKTLRKVTSSEHFTSQQCSTCLHVFLV